MKKSLLLLLFVWSVCTVNGCGSSTPPPPPATHFGVMAAANSATAGTSFNVTVSALDASGAVVSSYSGTVHFTSTDSQAALPADSKLTNGTGTFSVTLKTAGNQTVTARDTATASITGISSSINVRASAVATQFSLTPSSASVAAGTSFNITVNALDASNNVVTSYSGTVHFSSSDNKATLPADSTLTNGTGTFSVTLKTAGSQTITSTDASTVSISGTANPPISVNAGPAAILSLQAGTAVITTGIAFPVAVNVQDSFGNVANNYTGTVNFTSSDAQAVLPANSPLTNGTGAFSATLKTVGNQTITATDTVLHSLKGMSSAINVVSNTATHLSVGGPVSVNTRATFQFTVNALDAANNVSVGYSGTVQFSSSDTNAKLPASSMLTAGTAGFSATLETAGTQMLTAADTTKTSVNGSSSIAVTAAAQLTIGPTPPPNGKVAVAYDPRQITIRHCRFIIPPDICYQPTYATLSVTGFPLLGGGGVPPYTWGWAPAASSSLPTGLGISRPPGCETQVNYSAVQQTCINGTPTQPGTYNVVVTATDSGVPSVQTTANYTITINDPPPPTVNTTQPLPPSVVNQPFTYTFTGSGYGSLTFSESGALPAGIAFNNSNATLSGTPTQTGSFPITVTATDQFKQNSAPADFTIVVSAHGFYVTGSMKAARLLHTATLLTGGKVLIAGGQVDINNVLATAELYDPITGSFTATGNLQASRSAHTATLLNDGRVLLAGGVTGTALANAVATAELYDPTGATSSATGSMLTGRYNHTATLLNNGQVLVAGGRGADGAALGSAELFNPATGVFSSTGAMNSARSGHTATLLANGMVLMAGGANSKGLDTAEIYDPAAKNFTTVVGIMTVTRVNHTATLFLTGPDSGKVLLAGGFDDSTGNARDTAELFDPTSKSFAATTNMISAHADHTAILLNDGTVLLAGGMDSSGAATAVVELFDPTSENFSATGSLVAARESHTSTLLTDGRVLVTGGANVSGALASAELYK
jgi:hypothetical protein